MPFYKPLQHHLGISVAVRKENGDAVVFDEKGNKTVIVISERPCPISDMDVLIEFGLEQWEAAQRGTTERLL